MKTDELREKYLDFYVGKGHTRCDSDVLVPTWDPSVLFTPAGMNQFKDHFLGKVKLDFTRATTCQKCLRTGDIDNVGRTAYHHTFFEMMGNFSFGDYFKRDAIHWAWEFLTDKKWLGIDPARLTVSVYKDDDEAAQIWSKEIGLSHDRIARLDEDENFWPASAPSEGPDGVCGPCSEIFYHNEKGSEVEIWNLVFTQFNRVGSPPDNLRPLPSKNIDTGMGLERTAATLQGVETNFHIDILMPIVQAAAEVCGRKYEFESDEGRRLRRITDHVRACTMAIHENVYPGPQKEKYVIRRLLRRAVVDGYQLDRREPFLHQIVPAVVESMKAGYPELEETAERVTGVVQREEEQFLETLHRSLPKIEELIQTAKRDGRVLVDGRKAYHLYETYGAPPELIGTLAEEAGLTMNWDEFKPDDTPTTPSDGPIITEVFRQGPIDQIKKSISKSTEFLGYDETTCSAHVRALVELPEEKPEDELSGKLREDFAEAGSPKQLIVILDRSPFYGESGGQVGDQGQLNGTECSFRVIDTKRDGDLIKHYGYLEAGRIAVGQAINAQADVSRRQGIRRAHSATHILHYALQKNLGSHAQQQGSKVDDDLLRFDFTNLSPVSTEQLAAIEQDANEKIRAGDSITAQVLPLAEAREAGAMMLFGEKYPDPVRMISMGQFSKELCGGTHLDNTSEVRSLEVTSEEGVSAGVRRIIALTGEKATQHVEQTTDALAAAAKHLEVGVAKVPQAARELMQTVRDLKKQLSTGSKSADDKENPPPAGTSAELSYADTKAALRETARLLNVNPFEVPDRIVSMLGEVTSLTQQVEEMAESGELSAETLLEKAEEIDGVQVVVEETRGANPNLMRQLIDQIRKKTESSAVLLATCQGDSKVVLVAGVSRNLVDRGCSAGNWVREVAPVVGGGGGGKPDMAQAGGKNPDKVPEALVKAKEEISRQLAT